MISKIFTQNVIGAFGEDGRRWLEKLPILISSYAKRWQIVDLKSYQNLSYNYVASARIETKNMDVVLKLGVPCYEFTREVEALKCYGGNGAVQIIDSEPENGAVLLAALKPGITLKSYFPQQDEQAVLIASKVMQKLHTRGYQSHFKFPLVEKWHQSLYKTHQNLPVELLNKARLLSSELFQSQGKLVLLHADLHHENILLGNNDEWFAIDPKGVIGEAAYEAGAFIRNPIPELMARSDILEITSRRLTQFSFQLGLDRQRLANWSFVQAVLSACWAEEENSDHLHRWIHCAEIILRS